MFYNNCYLNQCLKQVKLKATVFPFISFRLFKLAQPQIQWCPILKPSSKEFKNFFEYIEKVDKLYRQKYGMVKLYPAQSSSFSNKIISQVIPPPEWKAHGQNQSEALNDLSINGPIEQNIFGKGGIYECLLIQKKSMSLKEYNVKTKGFDKISEGLAPQEVEQLVKINNIKFWKNVPYSPPLYGADLLNTLMDDEAGAWNLNNLESVLKYSLDSKVKGVNTPYCYIGSWKTLFCWHKEDLDLAAINYLHQGKSKFWYSIPQNQQEILEQEARKHFPQHFSKCKEHLRHKTTLINPYLLKKLHPELKIAKMEHKPNQFMLIFPGAYHSGFNFGCNIAEAVNYAPTDWLRQVIKTKPCSCSKNNVKASHLQIYQNLLHSPLSKTAAFLEFQQKIFQEVEKQQSQENEKDLIGLKSQFSKKIRKGQKIQKLTYKGEDYDIDLWAQCDKCKTWRKTKNSVGEKQKFVCKKVMKKCYEKEKIGKSYITIQSD